MPDDVSIKAPTNGDAPKTILTEAPPQSEEKLKETPAKLSAQPSGKGEGGSDAELLEAIRQRQDEFLSCLAKPSWPRKQWRKLWKAKPPELLKVYGIIYNNLGEAQRLLAERSAARTPGFDRIERQFQSLLTNRYQHSPSVNIHAAWEFAGTLERAVLLLGDDEYILTRLESEREREQKKLPGSWSEYLAIEKLDDLIKGYTAPDAERPRSRAVESLAFLSVRRSGFERTRRAREELKAGYLNRLTVVLTLLMLLLLEVIYIASVGPGHFSQGIWKIVWMILTFDLRIDLSTREVQNALVAAMTGALGSTLSGFYKLRDETGGIATLRSFRSAMWAQPFVGATVGVLLMLLIMSGVLAIGTTGGKTQLDWLPLSVYCFMAGFSEPFFLGVVQRVAGAADKKANAATGAGADEAEGKTEKKKTP